MVSNYKYDLNDMYRQVELTGGPGFIRGTHTAWRHKNYVFIADEVFPATGVKGAKDVAAGRAYGRLQVIDVSNVEKPRSVALPRQASASASSCDRSAASMSRTRRTSVT